MESKEVPAVAVGTVDGGSKYGAGSKIRLNSTVSLPSDPSAVFTLAWSVASSGTMLDLASAAVTTTGANQPNLVVRANVLQAGVEYTFKLSATYPGQNPGESTTKVAISTPPRGGRIEVRDSATKKETTTGFELDTNFTLSAPSWTGEGNLYYTYVAVDASGAETILGHGQKKTTLSGVILNKGKMTLNVIVADAFGAEGRTSVPAQSGGSTGASVTIEAKAVSAAAADNLIGNALGAAKSGKVGDALGKIGSLFASLNAAPAPPGADGADGADGAAPVAISAEKKAALTKAGMGALGQALGSMTASAGGVEQFANALGSIAGDSSGDLGADAMYSPHPTPHPTPTPTPTPCPSPSAGRFSSPRPAPT